MQTEVIGIMCPMLAVLLISCLGIADASDFNVSTTLDSLQYGYDSRIRPNWGGPPVEIGVSLYFISIFELSTKKQTVHTDFYFRETWVDPRLKFNAPPEIDKIRLGSEAIYSLWTPDTFVPDGSAYFDHESHAFVSISKDGTVFKGVRVWAEMNFPMDLTYFPKDKQAFTLKFESYGFTKKDVVYKWTRGSGSVGMGAMNIGSEIEVLGFTLSNQHLALSTANYSRLSVQINCVRHHGHYVKQFYMPIAIIFLITWSTFWLSASSSLVRVIFLLTSLLAELNLLGETWSYLPEIGYSTMLEHYIFFGLIMTALAIAQYVLVSHWYGQLHKPGLETELQFGDGTGKKQDNGDDNLLRNRGSYMVRITQYIVTFQQRLEKHEKADIICRLAYPVIFVVYNMWYWAAFP